MILNIIIPAIYGNENPRKNNSKKKPRTENSRKTLKELTEEGKQRTQEERKEAEVFYFTLKVGEYNRIYNQKNSFERY